LNINRSHYYDWLLHHRERETKRKEERKIDYERSMIILQTWTPVSFLGYRKIAVILANNGYSWSSESLVRRLMRGLGIYSAIAVRNTSRPGKGKNHTKYPYLLRHMVIQFVNQVWSTDITYIALPHGFVYLCAVIDLYSRKVLSWRLSNTMDVYFCVECLEEAIRLYGVPSIFNSDQGAQFTSNEFLAVLKREHVRISMDSVGQALDNIIMERTWRSLKYEHIFLHDYSTMTELKAGLCWFINYFNTTRPHQSLGYYAPNDIYYNAFTGAAKEEEKLVKYS